MCIRDREDTIRLLYHVQVEQKVEREQVAKVTGTNKDESAAKAPKKDVYKRQAWEKGQGIIRQSVSGRLPGKSEIKRDVYKRQVFGIALIYFCIHIGSVRVKSA